MLSKNVHRIAVKKRGDLSECFYYSLCSLNFFIEELALKSEKVSHRSNRRKVLTCVKIHKLQRFHYTNVPGDLRKKITKWKVEFLKVKLICPYPLFKCTSLSMDDEHFSGSLHKIIDDEYFTMSLHKKMTLKI